MTTEAQKLDSSEPQQQLQASPVSNQPATQTSAVNRSITDLHLPTWLSLIAISALCRTTLQHPLNVAVSRKRISDGESPSLKKVFVDAMRGKDRDEIISKQKPTTETTGTASSSTGNSSNHSKASTLHPVTGARNLYRGFGAASAGNVVGEVFYLVTVETMRHTLKGDWYATKNGDTTTTKSTSGADERNDGTQKLSTSSPPSKTLASQVGIDAAAGMIGDVTAMLVCTPLSVAVNKQTTAGYGLNRVALYRTLPETLREMWHAHPRPELTFTNSQIVGPSAPLDLAVAAGSSSSAASSTMASKAAGVSSSTTIRPPLQSATHPIGYIGQPHQPLTLQQRWRRKRVDVSCGLKGWYAGLSASLVMLPASGLWWGSYGQLKRAVYGVASPRLEKMNDSRQTSEDISVVSITTATDTLAGTSHDPHHYPSSLKIITTEELRETLSMGHLPLDNHHHHHPHHSTSSHSVADGGKAVALTLKQHHAPVPWYLSSTDNPILNGLAGVLATLITTVLYNPVSVIRTRLQALPPPLPVAVPTTNAATTASNIQRRHFTTKVLPYLSSKRGALSNSRILTLSRELIQREGYRGFFKGTITNASVSVLDGLLFATLFELTKFGSDISAAVEEDSASPTIEN